MSEKLPKIASYKPFEIKVEAGKKYFWCSCRFSANQPFCDGAHKAFRNEDGSSIMKSIHYVADETKTLYFCGCKQSKHPILCDGTHNSLIDKNNKI